MEIHNLFQLRMGVLLEIYFWLAGAGFAATTGAGAISTSILRNLAAPKT